MAGLLSEGVCTGVSSIFEHVTLDLSKHLHKFGPQTCFHDVFPIWSKVRIRPHCGRFNAPTKASRSRTGENSLETLTCSTYLRHRYFERAP